VSSTLRDPQIAKIIRRHFIPVAVDANAAPAELRALFARTGGNRFPFVLYINDKGQYIYGTNGGRAAEDLRGDLDKVLGEKSLAVPKNREAELTKLVDELEKQLEGQKFKEALATFSKVQSIRGYSATKDRAFDLMDKAQDGGLKSIEEALAYAGRDDYEKARELLEKVPKEFAGLPVADQAKEHLNALKFVEAAQQIVKNKKGNWQQAAAQRLGQVLRMHPDTPYANLAFQRQQEILKGR
jgi:hypothetical protein